MVRYDAQVVIPVAEVVNDFFPHMTTDTFVRKVSAGTINLPLIRMEPRSQKSFKGVHVGDLARYLEACREAALAEVTKRSEG